MHSPNYRSSPLTNFLVISLTIVLLVAAALLLRQMLPHQADADPVLTEVPPTPTAIAALPSPTPEESPALTTVAQVSDQRPEAAMVADNADSNGGVTNQTSSLFIPSAGVYAPVIQVYLSGGSWNIENLGMNVGHLEGTGWFGNGPGNIVLSGHVEMRDGRKGVFGTIRDLKPGDLIILSHDGQERRYSVSEIRSVTPDDLSPLYPTLTDRLTLITCEDYDFFRNDYGERTIVVADIVG